MIRTASAKDVPAIVAMGLRLVAEAYTGQTGSRKHITALVARLIAEPHSLVLVHTGDRGVSGMLLMTAYDHPILGQRMATEIGWWMHPQERGAGVRLLRQGEQWAREQGAVSVQMVAPNARVARFYERVGYEALEVLYQKRFTP